MATAKTGLSTDLTTEQVIDLIFKDPTVKHSLTEFDDLGKKPHEILEIYPSTVASGRAKGETRYYVKCFKRQEDIQVYAEKKSSPEEIVRQLWLYKLHEVYGYPWDHIEVEKDIDFGTVTFDKAADIWVSQRDGATAKLIVEVKRPERKDGLNQLKSYLNAEGSPVGVWSNGADRIILYRPYPREFEDTLTEIPTVDQDPKDVLEAPITLGHLRREFDFKGIVQNLEELVLANSGHDEFNEIFKIIFAKIYDELAAKEGWDNRQNQELQFRKTDNPDVTYQKIDVLFRKAMDEWSGIFDDNEHIKLTPTHLQVCVGPLERIRLMGANMRIMDDAFEYLMPTVAKKKNGQFFTPRYVVDMCVKMLNPTKREYVLDPACGSAGFLLHTMDYVWPAEDDKKKEQRKHHYAGKYLWGIDFDERSAKVSRALMLIAGDGRSHIFRVNSLDPREWFTSQEGELVRNDLRSERLLSKRPGGNQVIRESDAFDYYTDLKFDIVLTNPPFSGEIRDRELLRRYRLAGPALARKSKKGPKEERDVLFIERVLHMVKPGGRIAIVLPQGKFNNSTLAFIREWILRRARLLAVVGLHPNTFKPHTGTKTSVLFIQRYTEEELREIARVEDAVKDKAPDYPKLIQRLINKASNDGDVDETDLPDEIAEAMAQRFADTNEADESDVEDERRDAEESQPPAPLDSEVLGEEIERLKLSVVDARSRLDDVKEEKKTTRLNRREDSEKEKLAKLAKKDQLAAKERTLKAKIKAGEKEIGEKEYQYALLTVKGRLGLLREDPAAITELRDKWIDQQIAKKLNYPIFMATCERPGKNSSGDYICLTDDEGNIIEDEGGNPLIDQDCIQYVDEQPSGVAEAFVEWAGRRGIAFQNEA